MDGNLIEDIKEKIDILEIVRDHVDLNGNLKALCPFHDESKPSFSVNPSKQYFHCFGCGVGGDVIKFLQLKENMSFRNAITYLADAVGVSLGDLTEDELQKIARNRSKEDILRETADFYHTCLDEGILDYLINTRGLNHETVSRFRVGYGKGGLRGYLMERGYSIDLCREAGVIQEDGRDFFYGRITIPYYSRGGVKLLRGRSHPSKNGAKYLNLPGYELSLFNEDDDHTGDPVILAEGEFDAMILAQFGFNAIGVPGVNGFKKKWAKKFEKSKLVYLAFDGDDSGRKGALKISELLGEKARIVCLREGQDVTDCYLNGQDEGDFQSLLNNAKSRLELKLDEIKTIPKNAQPEELKIIFKELATLHPVNISHYKEMICKAFNMGRSMQSLVVVHRLQVSQVVILNEIRVQTRRSFSWKIS